MKKKWIRGLLSRGRLKKMFRIMRVTFILVCCLVFYASASTYSQNTRFTLNYQNATILELIQDIESQSKFVCLYQISDLNLSKKVNAVFKNAKIEEILDVALKGEGLPADCKFAGAMIGSGLRSPKMKNENI